MSEEIKNVSLYPGESNLTPLDRARMWLSAVADLARRGYGVSYGLLNFFYSRAMAHLDKHEDRNQ
ncbi:MAG: hypothetical protein Fur0011_3640 [Candidatus Microgenomates bacterium]